MGIDDDNVDMDNLVYFKMITENAIIREGV